MASALTYAVLLALTVAAWAHVVWMAMTDDMAGMDMVMTPSLVEGSAFVAAWAVMMAAMMLPSALPMIGLYAATQRRPSAAVGVPGASVAVFTLVYLALWAATGVPLYFASVALSAITPDARACGVAVVLVVAGVFQFSPLKHRCLRQCRGPLVFMLGHWGVGWRGTLSLGWAHAVYCLGCCWALMVVLVAAGAMGLVWVLFVAALVVAEKILPGGPWIARAAGIVLVTVGLAVAFRPGLAMTLRGVGPAM
jgi:predicted metal-binding membrane protein